MKYFTIILCLLFINSTAYSQVDQLTLNFISPFFHSKEKIIYLNQLGISLRNEIIDKLSPDIIDLQLNSKLSISPKLKLTPTERAYINHELNDMGAFTWPDNLFPNSQSVSTDSLKAIFSNVDDGWAVFKKKYGRELYTFSKPIFFRNNELCIFYYNESCGGECGEGNLSIYKLENGRWKVWIQISHWVS
jgi:hypothetical protein